MPSGGARTEEYDKVLIVLTGRMEAKANAGARSAPFPASVDPVHFRCAGIQVEDKVVQGAVLGSAMNPLRRHVHHQGLQVVPGRQEQQVGQMAQPTFCASLRARL